MQHLPATAATLVLFTVIPLGGALIGWLTIALPLRLLFWPRRPLKVLGFTMHGILRARQGDLASALGRVAHEQLSTRVDVSAYLERSDVLERMEATIREKIGEFLDTKLKALNPMFGMVLGGSLRDKVQELLTRELMKLIPEHAGRLAAKLQENVDVAKLVEAKVAAYDLDQLEAMIYGGARRELRLMRLAGGAIGLIIGVAEALVVWLI